MYMMEYVAKHRATLPYYDRLPLIFPYKKVPGGFMGLNMHYLPLPLRARLMDALYDTANNTKYDESTRLRISYQILEKAAKFREFRPCVKRYLTSQVSSKFFIHIPIRVGYSIIFTDRKICRSIKTNCICRFKTSYQGVAHNGI